MHLEDSTPVSIVRNQPRDMTLGVRYRWKIKIAFMVERAGEGALQDYLRVNSAE